MTRIKIPPSAKASLAIFMDSRSTYFCINGFKNDCSEFSLPGNYKSCYKIQSESGLFSMSPKEASDVILKGLSEIEINEPFLRRKISSIQIIKTTDSEKNKTDSKKFFSELTNLLQSMDIGFVKFELTFEEKTDIIFTQYNKFEGKLDSMFLLEVSDDVTSFGRISTSSNKKPIVLSAMEPLSSWIIKEKLRVDSVDSVCRHPLNNIFKSSQKGKVFANCLQGIEKSFSDFKKIPAFAKAQGVSSKSEILLTGISATEIKRLSSKDKMSFKEFEDMAIQTCEITMEELKRVNKLDSSSPSLCLQASYIYNILKSLNSPSINLKYTEIFPFAISKSQVCN